jgi:hypothetical protein
MLSDTSTPTATTAMTVITGVVLSTDPMARTAAAPMVAAARRCHEWARPAASASATPRIGQGMDSASVYGTASQGDSPRRNRVVSCAPIAVSGPRTIRTTA